MLQESLHIEPIRALTKSTVILEAVERMEDHKVSDLPVVDELGKYVGMVGEDALLNSGDDEAEVASVVNPAHAPYTVVDAHPFEVLAIATQYRLTVVPVIDEEGRYISAYLLSDLVEFFRGTPTLTQPGAILVYSVDQAQYSMSTVAASVEQNDAKILGLWLIAPDAPGEVKFVLKVNVAHSSPIVQSLQRYGFRLDGVFGDTNFELDYQQRYRHLMNYLKY